jgi:uncharacterized membrane protein
MIFFRLRRSLFCFEPNYGEIKLFFPINTLLMKIKTIKLFFKKHYTHLSLLCSWIVIGVILRFTNLQLKPPWSDEWATLVFSLGHSFRSIPLNEVISLDVLLSPLKIDLATTTTDTVNHLLTESTHPPLYFVLNHWWLQFIGAITNGNGALVSLWWARCFSALWGVVAILGMFALALLWFRSLITAQIASALMAVSPFGIYLAQEARHYTLAILWLITSLACLIVVIKKGENNQYSPQLIIIISWIVANILGVATHYFFALALVAETIVLSSVWWRDVIKKKNHWLRSYWQKIYLAVIATFIGCLPWLVLWRDIPDNQLTNWVYQENSWLEFYEPIGRILLWLITQVFLLPVEGVSSAIAVLSGIVILVTIGWLFPDLLKSYRALKQGKETQLSITIIERFCLSAIALILIITYVAGADLTLSSRFQFFYFPGWLLFLATILSHLWQSKPKLIVIFLALGICGSLSINHNVAFQKVERADIVVPVMVEAYQQTPQEMPVVIAIQHYTHGQTGEIMSLAWQFQELIKQKKITWQPQFLLAHQATIPQNNFTLELNLNSIARPFQLWLVNFSPTPNLNNPHCIADENYQRRDTGYKYRLYMCSL